ncbi:MAG: RHS repeat-associated core domain-containing protein, partial [Archangium sp.]|nr:RHS repeat-associated core domain-containing protein [Archangium sp.]
QLDVAGDRHRDFLQAQANCTSYSLDGCGLPHRPSFVPFDINSAVAAYEANLRAQIDDNIIRVRNNATTESETRYSTDPFASDFDRATRQRWGSSAVTPTPVANGFETTLPEASLAYVEATPLEDGTADATTDFITTTFAVRYPLESAPTNATDSARAKGMLLTPGPVGPTVTYLGQQPPLAVGFQVPHAPPTVPSCKNGALPRYRAALAGYQPAIDYFETSNMSGTPLITTPGVDSNASLKRSRLSCATLAMAQTWDSRSNDLISVWQNDAQGVMRATRAVGFRAKLNANANRICAWSRVIDRDGVTHLYGLNYQGRTLVDGVQLGLNNWRIAETLYNADGNVISQRRTMSSGTAWAPTQGDTTYEYMDVFSAGGVTYEPKPFYWVRRGNVVRSLTRPRGSAVDYAETGTAQPTPLGRYVRYSYEPLFNGITRVTSGTVTSGGETQTSVTDVTFDFQEGNVAALTPLLRYQQTLGFQYTVNASNVLVAGDALPWSVAFNVGDANVDGQLGPTLGLPVRVVTDGETTRLRWNTSGHLTSVLGADDSEERFEYYPADALSGTSAATASGSLAKRIHVARTSWWSEPALGAPCAALAGPYQWLLPSGCSTSQLTTSLKLPADVVAHITAPALDGETRFEYFESGHLQRRFAPQGAVVEWERDADGRETRELIKDGTTTLSSVEVGYDTLKFPNQWVTKSAAGVVIAKRVVVSDEDGNPLVDCSEWQSGGCTGIARGVSPIDAAATSLWYTNEGRLQKQVDPEAAQVEHFYDARGWLYRTQLTSAGELPRESCVTRDDDGNTLRTDFGGGCGVGALYEARTWDGFGRVTGMRDEQARNFTIKYTNRDLPQEAAFVGAPAWSRSWTYDTVGRQLTEKLNGTLVEQVTRAPGGLIKTSQTYGNSIVFSTYDADGRLAWERDADGKINRIYTSRPNSRVATSSAVRYENLTLHTTSSIARANAIGALTSSDEVGTSSVAATMTRSTSYVRDEFGRVTREDDADGARVEFVYDLGGRLEVKRELQPVGLVETSFWYDRRGAVKEVKDPKGETTLNVYTGYGELKTKTAPGAGGPVVEQYLYDSLGRMVEERHGTARLNYVFNAQGQLWKIQRADTLLRQFGYDALGRLSSGTHYNIDAAGLPVGSRTVTSGFTYDWAGRLASQTSQIAGRAMRSVTSSWSTGTLPTTLTRSATRPGSVSWSDTFDMLGRHSSQSRPSSSTAAFTWVGELSYQRTVGTATQPVRTTLSRDGLAQVTGADTRRTTSYVASYNWTAQRDAMGRTGSYKKTTVLPSGSTENRWRGYTYGISGFIDTVREANAHPSLTVPDGSRANVEALSNNVAADVWSYSREAGIGSTVSITRSGSSPRLGTVTRGEGYQVSSFSVGTSGALTMTYDTAGRATTSAGATYTWDDFSSLLRVQGSGINEWLQYDALGRLIARWNGSTLAQEYVWDGQQMASALDVSSNVVWQAFWGDGLDNLVSVNVGGVEYSAVTDGKGSIGAWYRVSTSALSADIDYTPEGRVKTRNFTTIPTTSCDEWASTTPCGAVLGIPFAFHGAFRSPATGLYYFRNRWYSALSGEWLSQDPLGAVDSHNLYAFNAFDSVNFKDPLGLSKCGAGVKACDYGADFKESLRPKRTYEGDDISFFLYCFGPACTEGRFDQSSRNASPSTPPASATPTPAPVPNLGAPPRYPFFQPNVCFDINHMSNTEALSLGPNSYVEYARQYQIVKGKEMPSHLQLERAKQTVQKQSILEAGMLMLTVPLVRSFGAPAAPEGTGEELVSAIRSVPNQPPPPMQEAVVVRDFGGDGVQRIGVIRTSSDGVAVALETRGAGGVQGITHGELGRKAFGPLQAGERRLSFTLDGNKALVTGGSTGFEPNAADLPSISKALQSIGAEGVVKIGSSRVTIP